MTTSTCTATTMCGTMAQRADPYNAKGLRSVWTVSRDTTEQRFLGVAYATGRKDKGLMLNTCPWCRGEPGYFKRES
ncbi:hypothetical protein [Pseudorhodoferax sp. Leaf265]|uniref:hypothetical protein n=1 Tax=Pseudorhodoferax sp. Leaf265 TaxID=1736315 RepID=UPI0006F9D776|nr:hypothetical protein [Pseudorhodoferax sp. Leaf265]KQP02504.1 hypothetical protein ASF45_20845 [Pseudorhodoferax sp. Leaf265]